MNTPKLIEVNGRSYRWTIRNTSFPRGPLLLSVEDTETKDIFQRTIAYDIDSSAPTITPTFVREVILNLDKPLSR